MSVVQMPGKGTVWQRELHNRDPRDVWVYIIAYVDAESCVMGPVKIGISENPVARLKSLQTGNSGRLVLVAKYGFWRRTHALRVEQAFHRAAAQYQTVGEWFDILPDSAVALMAENIKGFVKHVLQPDTTGDFIDAMSMVGIPGFDYALTEEDFGHGQ